jgi:MFS family permease
MANETAGVAAPTPRIRKMQITALVLLVLCGVINYLDRSALAVANVLIRQELGLNATSMGVLLSTFLLAYALSQIPVGFLIDRLGPRTLLGCAITRRRLRIYAPATPRVRIRRSVPGSGRGCSSSAPCGARSWARWAPNI